MRFPLRSIELIVISARIAGWELPATEGDGLFTVDGWREIRRMTVILGRTQTNGANTLGYPALQLG